MTYAATSSYISAKAAMFGTVKVSVALFASVIVYTIWTVWCVCAFYLCLGHLVETWQALD
jgi:hypothetical protein